MLRMFNLQRPTVDAPRRAPTRRQFEGENDAFSHLLPSYSEITARLSSTMPESIKHMFSGSTSSVARFSPQKPVQDKASYLPLTVTGVNIAATSPAPPDSTNSTPFRSPSQDAVKTTPKKLDNSVFSKLAGLDPTKVMPPGARPSPPPPNSTAGPHNPFAHTGSPSPIRLPLPHAIKKEESVHSPLAVDTDVEPLPAAQLDRAAANKGRRAPAKKKFAPAVEDVPPTLTVVPIAASATAAPTPSKLTAMGALKAMFTSRRPSVAPPATASDSPTAAAATGAVPVPAVLQGSPASSHASPTTPGKGIGAMLTAMFASKNKPKATTQSAATETSSLSGITTDCTFLIVFSRPQCTTHHLLSVTTQTTLAC
jgi:hypothetical protein